MANEEALGLRKTVFVLVVVVGCFAMLWPRILSPLILGNQREQLKPNQYDRDAGCCEVIFETEMAVLELLNEVCNSIVHSQGPISPYAAIECRKAVNETCGVDIQAFLKRSDNVGRTSKALLDTMKASNSSCLKEHFGVPIWSLSVHTAINSWIFNDTLKQERPLRTGVPHPAMLERGRAIPAGIPPPRPAPLPAHIRVWHTDTVQSPLAGYYDIDIKPPPIPGMRPPLGAGAGGPAPPSKSPMGLLMPIYTICIVVFFVFTLSKLLFKRTSSPYEEITPDPHFRRRVFRDSSRQSPDKLVVTAISGLVAEVQQQMEASYARNQQTQEAQDNLARPYTNGRVIHSGPVQIVASQYITPEPRATEPSFHVTDPKVLEEMAIQSKETLNEKHYKYAKEPSVDDIPVKESDAKEASAWQDLVKTSEEKPIPSWQFRKTPEPKEYSPELREESPEAEDLVEEEEELDPTEALIKLTKKVEEKTDNIAKLTGDFLREEEEKLKLSSQKSVEEQFADLLEEAMEKESHIKYVDDAIEDLDNGSVKVVGMEFLAHAADGGEWPNSGPPLAPSPTPPAHAVISPSTNLPHQPISSISPLSNKPFRSVNASTQNINPPSQCINFCDQNTNLPSQFSHSSTLSRPLVITLPHLVINSPQVSNLSSNNQIQNDPQIIQPSHVAVEIPYITVEIPNMIVQIPTSSNADQKANLTVKTSNTFESENITDEAKHRSSSTTNVIDETSKAKIKNPNLTIKIPEMVESPEITIQPPTPEPRITSVHIVQTLFDSIDDDTE